MSIKPGLDDAERRIRVVIVDRNAECADFPLRLQVFECALPFVPIGPLRVPDMKLQQVDDIETEILQALFGRANDVVAGKRLRNPDAGGRGPEPVLRWNFGRDEDLVRRVAGHSADQLFAVSVTVHQRGIDEVHAQFDRAASDAASDSLSEAPIHMVPPMPHAP